MTAVLDVQNLHVSYGPIKALRGVSLTVAQGETVSIVGANGAGKSTLMRALSGILPIASGEARFLDQDIKKVRPHDLARNGMLHVPEGRGTLHGMSVQENLMLAWEIRPAERDFDTAVAEVYERFPRLRERSRQYAGNLSGGEQQMLAIARALINRPQLLLVDEPSMGLSPLFAKEVFKVLAELRDSGMTILLVEQNVRSALGLAHRAYVLNQGVFLTSGNAAELAADPAIMASYLGHGKVKSPAAASDSTV
jgi:branched-chain amino acid transport system ATP-binding protein